MKRKSEIINNKKKLILKVDQTADFVYPNELYKYQIYCKNVSGDVIKDVHIQVYNPSEVAIDQDEDLIGIEIGDLNNGESHLLFLSARCSTPGEFTVHFICYGEESEVNVVPVQISCDYESHSKETIHKIHIYNFSPYEETYELMSKDYSDDVTQLIKKQKLPYGAKNNPFKMIGSDLNQNIFADESELYIEQKNTLYGEMIHNENDYTVPPYKTDEHSYQYIERENFNREAIESYEGENLTKIFNDINKYSKFFNVKKIRTGTNKLLHDFREYDPNGFIYRFGLMSSEIFHNVGVLPTYSYMNDYLFTWAAEGELPSVLYPQRIDMNWDANKWAGHGWNVWKTYTDEYKEQIINNENYSPLFEFIQTFESLETAQTFISNEYNFDASNEFYIRTKEGLEKIRKYQYIIKESYYDNGVFFVHIPISKIPSNFPLLSIEQIEAIIERSKPFGMKALVRYVIDVNFNIHLGLKCYPQVCPQIPFKFEDIGRIGYTIIPYKYRDVIETICYQDGNELINVNRESTKMIPSGVAYSGQSYLKVNPKMEFEIPEPTKYSNVSIDPSIENQVYACQTDNDLTFFSEIKDLLYQGNFNSISFKLNNVNTRTINDNDSRIDNVISAIDYKLWIDSLSDEHSYWPSMDTLNEREVDLVEIPLDNPQLTQENIEMGIGFEDYQGKLHGLSSEYSKSLGSFKIRYATSLNNNFKIKKEGLCDIIGLAYKFVTIGSNTLVVFLLKTQNESNIVEYQYFHHIVINHLKNIFCFTRNDKDISSIGKWSNLIRYGTKIDPIVTFNTPKYQGMQTYDSTNILNKDNTSWKNLNRIDKNEHSYAIFENQSIEEQSVDSINIHFDNIDIPKDSIVQNIKLKTIIETNSYKTFYSAMRLQDSFITENNDISRISLYPLSIEGYKKQNLKYYQDQYNQAKINEIEKDIKLFENNISKNLIFNDSLGYSIDYLDDANDYITVNKSFWIELSDFSEYNISMNNIKNIKFCIEGYNDGKEVYLYSQLKEDTTFAQEKRILIPTGYFKKYIPLTFFNSFFLDTVQLRFKFERLNDDINIFDTYLDVEFKDKQNVIKDFEEESFIDINKKNTIETILNNNTLPGYILRNGLTVKLDFDDLNSGEYYRIYSVELIIIYQEQNISFLANSNSNLIDNNNEITVVNGKSNNNASGMFFNEIIMPEAYQPDSTVTIDDQGMKLEDALFQSFKATTDNITSVTIFPNGFVGNPDLNLKIGLYENKSNTPNKLIKEIRVSGWSKANDQLKNSSIITYDFNVDDLIIGNIYWLKISVDTPLENNYYLLKYKDSPGQFKLLKRVNNNYINTFGSLKFYVNTLNSFRSFRSLPVSEDTPDFSDPKVLITLSKQKGEAEKIKVQKVLK